MSFIRVVGLTGDMKTVPRSMYESYLKDVGYKEIKVERPEHSDSENWTPDSEQESEADSHVSEVESIPVSEMTSKQLKEYAKLKGIDVSGAQSTREARDIVRNWIQEEGA